jgi:hypothetical protein
LWGYILVVYLQFYFVLIIIIIIIIIMQVIVAASSVVFKDPVKRLKLLNFEELTNCTNLSPL